MITKSYHSKLDKVIETKQLVFWLSIEILEFHIKLRKRHPEGGVKDYEQGILFLHINNLNSQ